ncbi:MAG: amidohydrolase [Acidimicrobiales bacterium]|jgi:5-methylthioadenosine/S-adenosylhomocysteine deaminase
MTTVPERGLKCDLLFTGGCVITVDDDRRVIDPGAVAIDGNRIIAVGTPAELSAYKAARVVECRGRAIIPGLVDCHTHLFQYLVRGLGEGLELWPWLAEFIWPLATHLTREDASAGASIAALEAVRAGITTLTDNHYGLTDYETTIAVCDAIESVGARGRVARGMMGPETEIARKGKLDGAMFRYSIDEEIGITRAAMIERRDRLVTVWPAPENIVYCHQELVFRAAELAQEFGTGWHSHCSEARTDAPYYLESYGIRPVEWLQREGLLGSGATLAHAIFLEDAEVEYLGASATGVAYCPVSHAYIGLGVMRLSDLRRAGAIVGLGIDGACAHRQDMFEQMKQSILLQRVHHQDPTASTAEEAFELATREGARYLGIDAGVIAPGKLADLAVVDLSGTHFLPLQRVLAALVYCARGSDVEMTIVNGEIVYEQGIFPRVDDAEIRNEATARATSLVERADLVGLRVPWRHAAGR